MEFTPQQIAKLVLGYLKKESGQAAVAAFCDTSRHLQHLSETMKNKKKYIITRVGGLSLVDYLKEYAVIYTLIQERLEDTEYFEENRSKNLADQLRYLLDRNGRNNKENTPSRSRSSTPMKEQNREHERLHFPKNLSVIEEVPSCNATPLQALPGNSCEDLPGKCAKTPSLSRSRKSEENGASDSEDSPDKSLEEDDLSMQVLTQTLLEHHELHEKIAENINLVRSTTEVATVPSSAEERIGISSGILQELDSAIKAIVQKTEADPIFEKLIGEIIGNVGETTDEEQTDGAMNKGNSAEIARGVHSQQSVTTPPVLESEESPAKQTFRNSKRQSPERLNPLVPEDPNVIQIQSSSATEAANENNLVMSSSDLSKVQQNLTVNTTTGEIILYDGTLDNFMKTTSTPGVSHASNSLLYNNGLLMVQPSVPAAALMPPLQVNPNKPCYMWNGSQLVNVSVPQLKVNNLTEQDILTMPTVIVCDDPNQQGGLNNLSANQQVTATATATATTTTTQKKFVNIAPRPDKTADKAENISEFLTLYQCDDSNMGGDLPPSQKISKPRVKSKKKSKKACQSTTIPVRIEVLKPTDLNEIKIETENCESKQQAVNSDGSKTPELLKRHRNLSTPKSGSLSHVRALDFNFGTPGKLGSPKKSPSTKISKSLFGTPTKNQRAPLPSSVVEGDGGNDTDEVDNNKIPREEEGAEKGGGAVCKAETKKATSSNSWDSTLRALAGPASDRCPTPKRKRKDSLRNRKPVKRTKLVDEAQPTQSKQDKLQQRKQQKTATATPNKIIKRKLPATSTEKPPDSKLLKLEEEEQQKQNEEVKVISSGVEAPADVNCVVEASSDVPPSSEAPFSLINYNAKARYKRKCNIDNNLKKEVKITKVKEIKSLEFVNDGSNKLILSPSKLNANKRTLVEVDEKETSKVQCASETETEKKKSMDDLVVIEPTVLKFESQEEKLPTSKFITPEMQRDPLLIMQQPVISKRNITPMLETPMKVCPKTPGLLSPINNTDTPFTKVFKEQLQGVDISCIQTPKFPLTPNFPFTPTPGGASPYPAVRPSDYSTSSSYYQPSDAEQNRSLEQLMIDECNRLENKKDTPVKIKINVKEEGGECPAALVEEVQSIPNEISESEQDSANKAIAEKMMSLSSNIIARKNLNLMDRANLKVDGGSSCTSSSSDGASETSSSDFDSDGDNNDDDMWNISSNATVVQRSKSNSGYNLRSRKGDVSKEKEKGDDVSKEEKLKESPAETKKSTELIQQIISEVEIRPTLEASAKVSSALSNHQEKVLQEMEEKRQRMIAKLKDDQTASTLPVERTTTKKNRKSKNDAANTSKSINKSALPPRKPNGRFLKVSGLKNEPKQTVVAKPPNRRKSNAPQKIPPNKEDASIPKLHLSSDSESSKLEPFDVVETELRESSTSSTPLPIGILETHPLKNFHRVLESITTNQIERNKEEGASGPAPINPSEKVKESNSDQEAESLVKGLKEWGIHLIHNKSPKKQGMTMHKTKTLQVPDNLVNTMDPPICSQTNDRKDELIKNEQENLQANRSLEEGEIVSEEECGSRVKSAAEVKKSKTKYVERRRPITTKRYNKSPRQSPKKYNSSSRTKAESKSVRSPVEKRKRGTSLKSKGAERTTSKSKGAERTSSKSKGVEKRSVASSKSEGAEMRSSTSSKAKTKEDTTENQNKKIDSIEKVVPPEIASVNKILDDLNLSNSICELVFDVKTFPEEGHLRLVHDESETNRKQVSHHQYDSELLNKKISANVYIESIDADVEKFMTVTPFAFILDIPEGGSAEPRVKILDCVTIRAENFKSVSPLVNLYEPQASSGRYEAKPPVYKCKKSGGTPRASRRRKSVDHQQTTSTAAPRQSRSKSLDQKMLLRGDKTKLKPADKEKKVKDTTSQTRQQKQSAIKNSSSSSSNISKVKASTETASKISKVKASTEAAASNISKVKANTEAAASNISKVKASTEAASSISKVKASTEAAASNISKVKASTEAAASNISKVKASTEAAVMDQLEEELSLKETVTIVEISESVVDGNLTTAESINDELMTYAICGSQRSENTEDPLGSANKQVKAVNSSDKLPNCQELLSKLNVDVFLNKLHGE